jgi:RimJ/RimL family protein N-acetyltransferase
MRTAGWKEIEMLDIVTDRLQLRETVADDLSALLPIYLSNPAFVEQNEGSEGEIGRYDLDRWQRDWQIQQMLPGAHRLGCYLKQDLIPVGFLDFLEEHEDGYPWLGALVIDGASHRQGFGSEAFQGLIDYAGENMAWTTLRAGVKAVNEEGVAFLTHLGFRMAEAGSERFSGGLQRFLVMEYSIKQ